MDFGRTTGVCQTFAGRPTEKKTHSAPLKKLIVFFRTSGPVCSSALAGGGPGGTTFDVTHALMLLTLSIFSFQGHTVGLVACFFKPPRYELSIRSVFF